MQVSAAVAQDTGSDEAYWRFHDAVARAQLTAWLDGPGQVLADISGPASQAGAAAAAAGNRVLHVLDPGSPVPEHPAATPEGTGRLCSVTAEGTGLRVPGRRVR